MRKGKFLKGLYSKLEKNELNKGLSEAGKWNIWWVAQRDDGSSQANATNLVSETFEKFGLSHLKNSEMSAADGEDEKEKQSPAFEFLKKLPDYGFLIDCHIWFPDDFFGNNATKQDVS